MKSKIGVVDIHAGNQLKLRRHELGLTQQDIAEKSGITFQQIQKYERGKNRMSASMLWNLSKGLDVPVDYFFAGLDDAARTENAKQVANRSTRSTLVLMGDFQEISPELQETIRRLIKAIRES